MRHVTNPDGGRPITLILASPYEMTVIVAIATAVIIIARESGRQAQRRFIETHPSILKIEQEA